MRKMNSLLIMAVFLILIQCARIHGWGITYTHPALTQYGLNNTEGGIHIREPGGHDFAEAFTKLKHNQEVIQIWIET